MDLDDLALKWQQTTDRSIRNEGRIKKLEAENEVLHQLATSGAVMAEQMKTMNQSITTLTKEVEEIRDRPAKKWDNIGDKIAWAVIAALLGFVFAQLGLT